jgi:hypothetical protein
MVKGISKNGMQSFDNCYRAVIKTIENKINAPVELREKEIYAFSFYFDRLNSAKLLKSIFKIFYLSSLFKMLLI